MRPFPTGGGRVDQEIMGTETPLLAFFTDERSGPARRMESLLAHLARKERGRLRVQYIDVDRHPDLVRRLHVGAVPTLLLIKDKRVVERLEGRASAPKIEQMLDPYLHSLAA
jgi:thioredoxin-like negative regulator of GroEL